MDFNISHLLHTTTFINQNVILSNLLPTFTSAYFGNGEAPARARANSSGEFARELADKAVEDLRNLKNKATDFFASFGGQ